jgi:hypothetical protein
MALLLDITVADDNLIKLLALLCEGSIPVIFQDIQSYNLVSYKFDCEPDIIYLIRKFPSFSSESVLSRRKSFNGEIVTV